MATERLLSSRGARQHPGVADIDDGDVTLRQMDPTGQRVEEYDYARGSHLYEDLPVPSKYVAASEESVNTNRQGPLPHEQSSWPSTISTSTTQLSNNNNTDSTRKRHNPLYDAVQKQYPGPPKPDDRVVLPSQKENGRRLACICGCALVATLIALTSLCVALYVLISIPPAQFAETNKDHEVKYELLKAQYEELSRKYSQLAEMLTYSPGETNVTSIPLGVRVAKNKMSIKDISSNLTDYQGEVSKLNQKQVAAVADLSQKLSDQSNKISVNSGQISVAAANVSSVNQKVEGLTEFVSNVSKMEGPQGPQGVGNLSACYYTRRQLKVDNAVPAATPTGWEPSNDILKNFVVMAATCSVTGGTLASLESTPVTIFPNAQRFRCSCSGVDSTRVQKDRICYLHLFLCPRLS